MSARVHLSVLGRPVCPATMCPLFAREGSPWTHEKNKQCPQHEYEPDAAVHPHGCMFWGNDRGCDGAGMATAQVNEARVHGGTLQIGPVYQRRHTVAAPTVYNCPRAGACQWQRQSHPNLCPPRAALAAGVDPRAAAW